MTRTASAHGLTAARATSWRDRGACNGQDPDLFAPDGTLGRWADVIKKAKAICNRCPVRTTCLEWALDNREDFGIFGGLTQDERWEITRQQAKDGYRPRRATQNPRGALQPPAGSLRELLDRHTTAEPGGHLLWTGPKCPEFQQRQLTPNRVAYLVDRGHEPDGMVQRLCGVHGCVQPAHLADTRERHQQAAAKAV
ncbi:WhiB family transcriptional regulator [Streptomyces caniscabiei]|uniref:Transcriptional regulator WhiB n=2 Tax=Streptomyces caniscabiei TaxID=2746961 RepID=A0ABU4MPP2_9ACTN|nr:WhiB family transcriptional regulator [Streptomyces caniscabiei]MBE4735758.1 WhiB family transcriptional regulator [Streptomyces caniscabiei]MBE4758375.1 WhiB family transcriptional regulator [Streptomyces caniscabiei]MBE4788466.1 WhiB family transcriptional regulator [Streptomyces caniscabiei]MDX2986394.1 WhiB family transcriptional regulator [Streptomyces caniscabiei]MDX3039398.1 WhiB family transcriptional regulator [Streptomyces caniscabiei]